MSVGVRHGPGVRADPNGPREEWGGRKAQDFTRKCLEEYGTVCWLCGLPGAKVADHVIPRSKGGAVYDIRNLGPAHKRCNESRGNRATAGASIVIESGLEFFRAN